jgi:branched-subunit amino acid aminotransferase/4-amino-4-deoxychorismate lyase
VAGVLRAALLREAARMAVPIRVEALPLAVLQRCTALAISNARMGLVTVHELDGRALRGSHPLQALAAQVARA